MKVIGRRGQDNLLRKLFRVLLTVPLVVLGWLALVRVVRYFVKFPMPQFMAPLIDNPFRHRFQPPEEIAWRHGIEPGMRVLDVGPGNGRYTLSTARAVGGEGHLVAVDIEPKMIRRLQERLQQEGLAGVDGLIADVHALPFMGGAFDAVYLITVIGEISEPVGAIEEFHRVLSPVGTLAFSEFFPDPDYPSRRGLLRKAHQAGFIPSYRTGSWFAYTQVFEKEV